MLEKIEGNGLTAYESINSIVEAIRLNMIQGRFSKLFIDQDKMDELIESLLPSQDQQTKAIELLTTLSKRELQYFLMHHIENLSMGDIAKELGVSKSAVQIYIERARKKLQH